MRVEKKGELFSLLLLSILANPFTLLNDVLKNTYFSSSLPLTFILFISLSVCLYSLSFASIPKKAREKREREREMQGIKLNASSSKITHEEKCVSKCKFFLLQPSFSIFVLHLSFLYERT